LIGIPADRRMLGQQFYHLVGEKYLAAVLDGAGGIPVVIPAIGRELQLDHLLDSFHGLLFMRIATRVSRVWLARCTIRIVTTPRCP
jgi:gamma-glutamyl-gamma-aminobutyrate hydrolase PuuD